MKKILTVSLGAIMAVGAARADLASTNYVDTAVNALETGSIKANTDKILELGERVNGLPTDANVKALGDKITALEADSSVTSARIANGAVTANKIDSEAILGDSSIIVDNDGSNINISLNPATASILGGVKQGDNVTIAADGTISAVVPTQLSQLEIDTEITDVMGADDLAGKNGISVTFDETENKVYVGFDQSTQDKLAAGANAVQVADFDEGSENGAFMVEGQNVKVHGLKSAAYTEASAYATAAQGEIATSIAGGTIGSTDGKYVLTAVVKDGTISGYAWELIDREYEAPAAAE